MSSFIEKGKQAAEKVRRCSKEFLTPKTDIHDIVEDVRKNHGDNIDYNQVSEAMKRLNIEGLENEASRLFNEYDTEKLKKITSDNFSALMNKLSDTFKQQAKKY